MGMSIDEAINRVQPYAHPYCLCIQITGEEAHQVSQAIMVLANTSQKYQMMQADYETRLKADMVAMLTEIQLEIEELDNSLDYDFEGYNQCAVDCEKLIQQKIDALKEIEPQKSEDNNAEVK